MLGIAQVAASPSFSSADSLRTLLTTESLVFAVSTATVALSAATPFGQRLPFSPRLLGFAAALFLTVLGAGGVVAWCDIFLRDWPHGVAKSFPVICILVGIVIQPLFAWAVASTIRVR
jgi:hypothetical protein